MDIRDRVMSDMPHSFLHKLAGIVPGFHGYMDRERRRDADKLLRTYLAHQYSAQRDRLNRIQQGLARTGKLTGIAEVDRLVGVFQRFIDRLNTATYGYSGLFDPVKVEAQELDQLYAFDMALTSGVDDMTSAIDAVEKAASATGPDAQNELPSALSKLSSIVDNLNLRLSQRGDLLTTGRGLPQDQYSALVSSITSTPSAPSTPETATSAGAAAGAPTVSTSTGTPANAGTGMGSESSSGEMARYSGGSTGTGAPTTPVPPYPTYASSAPTGTSETGTGGTRDTSSAGSAGNTGGADTTDLGNTPRLNTPPTGTTTMVDDNQGFAGMPTDEVMSQRETPGTTPPPSAGAVGTATGTGVETGSSPTTAPGAPGTGLTDGLQMGINTHTPDNPAIPKEDRQS